MWFFEKNQQQQKDKPLARLSGGKKETETKLKQPIKGMKATQSLQSLQKLKTREYSEQLHATTFDIKWANFSPPQFY